MSDSRTARVWPGARARFSVVIVGCGLIGGSIARAIRRRWRRARIVGIDRKATRLAGRDAGVLDDDAGLPSLERVVREERAAAVILALPLDGILAALPRLAIACRELPSPERPLVLDVGSVKGIVMDTASGCGCPHFVGGHPMAGSEHSGLRSSSASLLDGAPFVLCSGPGATATDRRRASGLVTGVGARPLWLDPARHDRCVATVSHVPHLTALALMEAGASLGRRLESRSLPWRLAAGSWRDATRVAAADPSMWRPVLEHNSRAIDEALGDLIEVLQRLRKGMGQGDEDLLDGGPRGVDAPALARVRRKMARHLP